MRHLSLDFWLSVAIASRNKVTDTPQTNTPKTHARTNAPAHIYIHRYALTCTRDKHSNTHRYTGQHTHTDGDRRALTNCKHICKHRDERHDRHEQTQTEAPTRSQERMHAHSCCHTYACTEPQTSTSTQLSFYISIYNIFKIHVSLLGYRGTKQVINNF